MHYSLYPQLPSEFDDDCFFARRLQCEEEEFRRQEEEKNLLALTKFLMEEEKEEKKRKQLQLEDSHNAALELQNQWNTEQQYVDHYNHSFLQRQRRDEEESLKLIQRLQEDEEEQQRLEREKQEYEDERFAAKMMLSEERERLRSTTNELNGERGFAVRIEKHERTKSIVAQMFQEHAAFERIAKRRNSEHTTTTTTTWDSFDTETSFVSSS